MAYIKQNFINGQVLYAEHLNKVEDELIELDNSIENNCSLLRDSIKDLSDEVKTKANVEDIKKSNIYEVTEGSNNDYTITTEAITAYEKGMSLCIEIHEGSTGSSTLNINNLGAVTILDSLGNEIGAGGLKKNIPYNLRYNGVNFIVLGKGGGGNATPDKILSGYKATVDSGQIVGTMPNKANVTTPWCGYETISVQQHPSDPTQGLVTIPTTYSGVNGYYGEGSKVTGNIASLNAGNIKAGVKIGRNDGSAGNCITGTFTNDATAQAGHILSGQSAYVKGNKVNGNIPVLTGVRNATGVARWGDSGLAVYPERGYQKGGAGDGEIKVSQAQLINTYGITANKIVSGQEIAGVAGNATSMKRATGTVSVSSNASIEVNLGFYPTILIFRYDSRSSKSSDPKWNYGVFTPVLKFTCWKDKSYSDASVNWTDPSDPRTSTGFTATGHYYNSTSDWTYEAIGF